MPIRIAWAVLSMVFASGAIATPGALVSNGAIADNVSMSLHDTINHRKVGAQTTALPGDTMVVNHSAGLLDIAFKDSWSSQLLFSLPTAFIPQAQTSLELTVNPVSMDKAAFGVSLNCAGHCNRTLRLREWAMAHIGQGWQTLRIPLTCLQGARSANHPGEEVNEPANLSLQAPVQVGLQLGGEGQLQLKSVKFTHQPATLNCVEDRQLATTPAPLNEYWSASWWIQRHEQKLAEAHRHKVDWVMLGDSITQGWESQGKQVWQQHFGKINTLNLGFGGDRTENLLWRLEHGELDAVKPKLITIMIGTNNTGHRQDSPQAIVEGVNRIISLVKDKQPAATIVLYAIFPRGADDQDELRQNNQHTNQQLAALAEKFGIRFIDINNAFVSANGTLSTDIMPDLLHPNAAGYQIWADSLKTLTAQYITEQQG